MKKILLLLLLTLTMLTISFADELDEIDTVTHIPLNDSQGYDVDIVRIHHIGDETRITLEFPPNRDVGFYTGGTRAMRLNGVAFKYFDLNGQQYNFSSSNVRMIDANRNSILYVFPRIYTSKFSLYECEHTSNLTCFNTTDADSGIVPIDDDPVWTANAKSQYDVPKNRWFTKTFTIDSLLSEDENLNVTLEGSSNIKLIVKTKDAYGEKEYRYKFVGKIASNTDMVLKLEDATQSFSKSIPIRFKVSEYQINAVIPSTPFILANGNDVTYPLDLAFDATAPAGSSAQPTCNTTVVYNGENVTLDFEVTKIKNNRFRCKSPNTNHVSNVLSSVDEFSVRLGFVDQYIAYKTVKVPVHKRDSLTATVLLEYMPEYEYVDPYAYVVVNKRYYFPSSNRMNSFPDKIYLGGDTALYGPRRFDKDTVLLSGGVWKLTYQGHEMLINLKPFGQKRNQIIFTVDGNGIDIPEDLVQFTFDPESTLHILVKKSPLLENTLFFLNAGTLWRKAVSTVLIKPASYISMKECHEPFSILSQSEAQQFLKNPCVAANDENYDEDTVAGVRGTTFTIEKKKGEPITFNVLEGVVDFSSASFDENITLYDMESLNIKEKKVSSVSANILTPLQEQYLQDTSLDRGDENSTTGTVIVNTNLENASYYIYDTDKVQVGYGKLTSFENLLEGSYLIKFLDVPGYKSPEYKLVRVGDGSVDNINANYVPLPSKDILSLGHTISDTVDQGMYHYYELKVSSDQLLQINLTGLNADLDLYVKVDSRPSDKSYDCKSDHGAKTSEACSLHVKNGDYVYIGVYGFLISSDMFSYADIGKYKLSTRSALDTDKDGIPNSTDTDDDNDGISDSLEISNGLNPLDKFDAQADFDNDGFSNAIEISVGTDIRSANSKPIWAPVIMMGEILIFVPAKP